jgi:hypothetical protein
MVPPLVPPVLDFASYVPAACHAILMAIGHLIMRKVTTTLESITLERLIEGEKGTHALAF